MFRSAPVVVASDDGSTAVAASQPSSTFASPKDMLIKTISSLSTSVRENVGLKRVGRRVFRLLDSGYYQSFSAALLFLSLFMADSWTLGNAKDSQNDGLAGTLMFVFVVFALETIVFSFVQRGYFLSFFFWMDALGTLSILLDITWISQYFAEGSANQAQILRATRAAKLGARYGRLMRILKLMRFVQFLPCFAKGGEEIVEPTTSSIRRIVNQLNNALSIRVAFIVMTLVIVMPFLVYVEQTDYQVTMAWLTAIKVLAKDSTKSKNDILAVVSKFQTFYSSKDPKLHSVTIQSPFFADTIYKEFVTRDYLRSDNIVPYSKDYLYNGVRYKLKAELDLTKGHQKDALYGIIIILLVMILLVGGASSFQSAVDGIIVIPMEKLSNTLRTSATVMLKSMKVVEEEKKKQDGAGNDDDDDDDEDGELETQMLEKMVEKLARIAATMAPAQMGIGDDMKNVDKDTTTWLTAQYSNLSRVFVQEESKSTSVQSLKVRSSTSIDAIVSTDVINSWSLDVLDYKHDELIEIWVWIFGSLNVFEEFSFPEDKLKGFLLEISNRYVNDNTYHNFKHGCDVGHTVYRLLMSSGLNQVFNHLEVFCMLVAAIGHDVGHPGVNNPYLVKAKHELALKFNDRSPLENMHCTVIYEVLKKDKCNIFSGLSEPQWRDARKLILTTVLGTDMTHHFEQISKTQLFLEVNGDDVHKFCAGEKNTIDALAQEKDRLFILELCLHCADISNPYKPWKVCERWAHLVIEEFARQGDREKSEGLEISPMCDRATINLCNSQLGFIEFVVAPLIIAFVNIFPPLHECGSNMANNVFQWGEWRKRDIMADDKIADKEGECKKVDERIGKFKDKCAFTATLAAKSVRSLTC